MGTTVLEIKQLLEQADEAELAVLERTLAADTRKGVIHALEVARRRIDGERAERERLAGLYAYQREIADARGAHVAVGLDEVGRGSIAGPLAVGGVVLPDEPEIAFLNDSKQLSPERRETVAAQVKDVALAWTVEYIEPAAIDALGMTACLRMAFSRAVKSIEAAGFAVDLILLDGNPLHLDEREVNVVKGDGRCASIAAASVVAKVERDALMRAYAKDYPDYDWEDCKGYASAKHIDAIKRLGLTPLHRVSFCTSFLQESLF